MIVIIVFSVIKLATLSNFIKIWAPSTFFGWVVWESSRRRSIYQHTPWRSNWIQIRNNLIQHNWINPNFIPNGEFFILRSKIPNIGILGEEILKRDIKVEFNMLELVCAKFHSKRSIFHHFRGQNSKNRYQNLKIEIILGEWGSLGIFFGWMGVSGNR